MKCDICGQAFKPSVGHCRGGKWEGCCRSFVSNKGGDAHRVGKFGDGSRRCMTDEELNEKGWIRDSHGYWSSPADIKQRARARDWYKSQRAAQQGAKGASGGAGQTVPADPMATLGPVAELAKTPHDTPEDA